MDLKLGFLASHEGSNVKAILNNINNGSLIAEPKIIISNNPDANVLNIAKKKNVPGYCMNTKNYPKKYSSLEKAILNNFIENDVNIIVLAGYLKPIGKNILSHYHNHILNIHPSLLPKYGGKGMYGSVIHKAVIDSDDKESGATIHIVTQEYDQGPIIAQCKVPRYKNDTVETLAARVLKFEHVFYSQTLRDIQQDLINLEEF
ncbi:MAG: phosphoribosylglycinamide formyltransferase [archaeon]